MFKGIGRKLRQLVKDVWNFLSGEIEDLAGTVWKFVRGDVASIFTEELPKGFVEAIAGPARTVSFSDVLGAYWSAAEGDPALLAAINSAGAGLPFPLNVLGQLAGLGGVVNAAATIASLPKVIPAQVEAEIPYIPVQTRAQIEASLPFIPTQTNATWEAEKPLLGDQARSRWEAEKPIVPEQTETQVRASLPFIPEQTEAQVRASLPFIPEQTEAQVRASLPFIPDQVEATTRATLAANQEVRPQNIPTAPLVAALFRKIIDEPTVRAIMARLGIPDDQIGPYLEASRFYPTPQDLITWIAREVFEPDSIAKYGLLDEFERLDLSLFAGAGISEDQVRNFWISHWEHPAFTQITEMFRRQLLKREDVWEWFRIVEVPPFWRDKMIDMLEEPFTRVDSRRMWGLGTIDDDDVRRTAQVLGYPPEGVEKYLMFVKLTSLVPELLARFAKGWITEEQVRSELLATGLPAAKVELILQTRIKAPGKAERTAPERDLTKSEIYKGVRQDLLDPDVARDLLVRMGYDQWEADYLLTVNVGVLAGSPDSYPEFRDWVEKWRRAQGLEARDVPPDLVQLGRSIAGLKREIANLRQPDADQTKLPELEAELTRLQRRYEARLADTGLAPARKE